VANWLVRQRIDGPASRWSARYWEKLLAPLDRQVRVAKERQMRADRRIAYHPPPPTPQQIATTVETITDTPMLMANLLPNERKLDSPTARSVSPSAIRSCTSTLVNPFIIAYREAHQVRVQTM
jgi:hypothetical protein